MKSGEPLPRVAGTTGPCPVALHKLFGQNSERCSIYYYFFARADSTFLLHTCLFIFFISHQGTNSGSLVNFNDTLWVGEVHVIHFRARSLATQRGIACVEHMPHHSMIPPSIDGRRRPSRLKKNVVTSLTNLFRDRILIICNPKRWAQNLMAGYDVVVINQRSLRSVMHQDYFLFQYFFLAIHIMVEA